MSKQNDKRLESIRAMLSACGLKEDNYGHFQKDTQGKTLSGVIVNAKLRVKIQDISIRVELKRDEPGAHWSKIDGAYIKDVQIGDGMVRIGRKVFKVEE